MLRQLGQRSVATVGSLVHQRPLTGQDPSVSRHIDYRPLLQTTLESSPRSKVVRRAALSLSRHFAFYLSRQKYLILCCSFFVTTILLSALVNRDSYTISRRVRGGPLHEIR